MLLDNTVRNRRISAQQRHSVMCTFHSALSVLLFLISICFFFSFVMFVNHDDLM